MSLNKGSLFAGTLFFACFLSCTDNALVDQHVPVDNLKWEYKDEPAVSVKVDDNSKPYNLYMSLRHTADYKYANLFVLIHQQYPNGRVTTIRTEVKLAEPDGRWIGKGSGNLYTRQVRFAKDYHFADTGVYLFSFEQNMRENPLSEIQDIGLRVEPASGR